MPNYRQTAVKLTLYGLYYAIATGESPIGPAQSEGGTDKKQTRNGRKGGELLQKYCEYKRGVSHCGHLGRFVEIAYL